MQAGSPLQSPRPYVMNKLRDGTVVSPGDKRLLEESPHVGRILVSPFKLVRWPGMQ